MSERVEGGGWCQKAGMLGSYWRLLALSQALPALYQTITEKGESLEDMLDMVGRGLFGFIRRRRAWLEARR